MNSQDKTNIKIINSFINSKIDINKSYAWQTGYKNLGILLYGFCEWIHNQKIKHKADKIFFLARDGYLVKLAYEKMYPNEKNDYLYVSRRSLSLPAMNNAKNIDDILDNLILPPIFTIDVFLSIFNINVADVKEILKKVKISKQECFKRSSYKENPKIRQLTEMIFERIINISNNQYNNFTNYLKQKNFDHNLLVVDIGWHGSLQKLLQKITKTPKIFGCYIGIYDNANLLNDCEGYVFDKGKKLDEQYKLFSFVSLFETMFLAHEGTTISYRNVGQKIEAVLAPYEYDNDKKSLEIVSDIQKGTFKFIDDYKNSNININLNANICSYNILKFGSSPNKRDIETFGKISFENYQVHNIINFNKSSLYYFTHPKNMINDFFTSGWRVVFLKKLFKIPFPYYYLLKILCIVFKKEQ